MKRLNVGNHDHNKNKVDWEQYNTFHKSFMELPERGPERDDLTENFSVNFKKDPRTNELFYDSKFREICKDIGFSPKYQYQLMQLVVQLKPEV